MSRISTGHLCVWDLLIYVFEIQLIFVSEIHLQVENIQSYNLFITVMMITVFTGKVAAWGIWGSKSVKNHPAVAELLPDVTPT